MSDSPTRQQPSISGDTRQNASMLVMGGPIQHNLDVDAIMDSVRAELSKRGVATSENANRVSGNPWYPVAPRLSASGPYALAEFLRFSDSDFIDVAYRALLLRPANDAGSAEYLAALRSGAVDRVEILGSIRFSEEGQRHSVHVDGLLRPYKLRRWRRLPVIGWFLGFGLALAHLPRLARQLQAIEASAAHETQTLGQWVNRLDTAVARRLLHADHELKALRDELGNARQLLETMLRGSEAEFQASVVKLSRQLHDSNEMHKAALAKLTEQVRGDQRRLMALLERLTVYLDGAMRQSGTGGESLGIPEMQSLERQYASFENAFRGDREQIKLRVAHYLKILASAGIDPESDDLVIDLGSGRGEWLEVLAEHGYRARGVDLNRGMLKESELRGHEVVEADALNYLKTQDADSVAAITSMHVVEHLPNAILLQLIDEALRVLRPGGVLILETPNPENVLVGSCNFYLDPTHLNPIPPGLLQWTVQVRGFEQATIDRLVEHRGEPALLPVSKDVPGAAQINQMVAWFTAPPDYAVIARKPSKRSQSRDSADRSDNVEL